MDAKLSPISDPQQQSGVKRPRVRVYRNWDVHGESVPEAHAVWAECRALAIEAWRAQGRESKCESAPIGKSHKRPNRGALIFRALKMLKRSLVVMARRRGLPVNAICDAARLAGNHRRLSGPVLARQAAKEGIDGPTWLAQQAGNEWARELLDAAEERRRRDVRKKRRRAYVKGKPDPVTGEVHGRPGRPSNAQIAARTRAEQREFLGESGGSAGWGVD